MKLRVLTITMVWALVFPGMAIEAEPNDLYWQESLGGSLGAAAGLGGVTGAIMLTCQMADESNRPAICVGAGGMGWGLLVVGATVSSTVMGVSIVGNHHGIQGNLGMAGLFTVLGGAGGMVVSQLFPAMCSSMFGRGACTSSSTGPLFSVLYWSTIVAGMGMGAAWGYNIDATMGASTSSRSSWSITVPIKLMSF